MGIFSKRGKNTPEPVDADATVALDKSQLNSSETAAILPTAEDGATQAIDGALTSSAKTVALDVPDITADATMVMPKVDDDSTFVQPSGNAPVQSMNVPVISTEPFAETGFSSIPERKDRRGLKAFFITFFVLAFILACVYVGIAMMFKTQFMPNTFIQGLDVSMMKDDEVVEIIDQIPADYQIDVVGGKFSLRMTGEDVGMTIDTQAIIDAMHEDQNAWYWPWYATSGSHNESHLVKTAYNEESVNKLVEDAVKSFNKKAKAPTDASIIFDEKTQAYVVKPEEIGEQLDVKAVQEVANKAIKGMESKVELTDEQLKPPKLLSTDKKLVDTAALATGMVSAHLVLKINGQNVDEIGSEILSNYISISDSFEVKLNEEGLANWVAELAGSYDTVGMERSYTRADGKYITVWGGTYGWEVDEETLRAQIMDAIKAGGEHEIEIPCIDAANIYAGRGQRDWGNRYIDVDLSEQHVRFYGDDGSLVWETDCITGAPDGEHETPMGVWYVIMKQSPSVLIGYKDKEGKIKDYEEPVTYWMPFVGNSVGFHDATWQPSFGGDMYAIGYGSHGCVNLSYSAAKSLYEIIQPNDVVVVHY